MSHVQDRAAGEHEHRRILQRGVPSEGRPFEARAWAGRGTSAAAARRAPTLTDAAEETAMQVTAISTPRYPEWRWRITGYAGETVEESPSVFPPSPRRWPQERSGW